MTRIEKYRFSCFPSMTLIQLSDPRSPPTNTTLLAQRLPRGAALRVPCILFSVPPSPFSFHNRYAPLRIRVDLKREF